VGRIEMEKEEYVVDEEGGLIYLPGCTLLNSFEYGGETLSRRFSISASGTRLNHPAFPIEAFGIVILQS
jgi:hypothetical protein